jgi:molybdopterin converting factor subunit 1
VVAYSCEDMRVRVLYFGVLKEIFSRENEMLEVAEGTDVAALLRMYRNRGRAPSSLWDSLAVAVNQEYARAEDPLRDGDEVALLPPVSGGRAGAGRAAA